MTKQPIMIRVVVVCPVTGCYRVRWVPATSAGLTTDNPVELAPGLPLHTPIQSDRRIPQVL